MRIKRNLGLLDPPMCGPFSILRIGKNLYLSATPMCGSSVFRVKNLGLSAPPVCGPFSHVSVQKKHGSFYHDGVQKLVPFCNTLCGPFRHTPLYLTVKICLNHKKSRYKCLVAKLCVFHAYMMHNCY